MVGEGGPARCRQGWGNVLSSGSGQHGEPTSSHLGTGRHWEVRVLGKAPSPLQQSPPGAQLGTATLGRAPAIASLLPLLLC